ncbi:hypothetical protein CBL_10517 [Carabus blaptoides fortunei]
MTEMKTHPLKVNDVKVLWEELSNILKRKKGAIKIVEEWRNEQLLVNWKSKTSGKARMLKKDRTGTGGGPATGTNLTNLEEGLMVLIGWNTVEDCDAVAQELPPEEIPVLFDVEVSHHRVDWLLCGSALKIIHHIAWAVGMHVPKAQRCVRASKIVT